MTFRGESKVASCAETVRIWSLPSFDLLHEFSPISAPSFLTVSWSTDGNSLVSAPAYSNSIVLTNLSSKKNVYNAEASIEDKVTCAKFNRDSTKILVGCKSGAIISWSVNKKKAIKTYAGHSSEVTSLNVNSGNTHVASGSDRGEILVHNLVSGMYGAKLMPKYVQSVQQVRFSMLKISTLGSATDNGNVDLWDINSKKIIHNFECAHDASATSIAFSPINSFLLLSVGLDKKLNFYDLRTKRVVLNYIASCPLVSLDFLDDGRTALVGGTRGQLFVYDLRRNKVPIKMISAHSLPVRAVESKKFHFTSKSEDITNFNIEADERSVSTSDAVDYTKHAFLPNSSEAMNFSPEYDVFSPVRESTELKAKVDETVERRLSYSSNDTLSPNESVLLSVKKKTSNSKLYGVFSPARDDEEIGTPSLTYSELREEISKMSVNTAFDLSLSNGQLPLNEVSVVDSNSSLPVNDTLDELDTSMAVSNWQTNAPSYFTEMRMPVAADNSLSYSLSESNKSTDGPSTSCVTPSSLDPLKVLDESRLSSVQESSPVQNVVDLSHSNPQVFQMEFLTQLLDDKLEEFRVRMQQPYFQVLAQLVKQSCEMKEELQTLKEYLTQQTDLQQQIRELKAENIRLRTAF